MKISIYKLTKEGNCHIYVESTKNMTIRYNKHKTQTKYKLHKVHYYILENGSWDQWKMELIENIECTTLKEKYQRE